MEPNTILSFYNGIRLHPSVQGDLPDWADNAYRIFDPTKKSGTIDIPKEFIDSNNYCASLAHKTNHSFMPNAELVIFDHPRFGLVPSILSTQDIGENEEIFVHYGYELDDCPAWYEDSWNQGKTIQFSCLDLKIRGTARLRCAQCAAVPCHHPSKQKHILLIIETI